MASIASLQVELLFEGNGAAGALAGAGRRASACGARGAGAGAAGTTALADGADGFLATVGGVAVGAAAGGSDAALAGGCDVATGVGRSGSASITSERPTRSRSEASQSRTGQVDRVTAGPGGSTMPRLEEIV